MHCILNWLTQITHGQGIILRFLRHLLPILTPLLATASTGQVISKVQGNLDFWLPFRQHAPSLANGRREIYAKVERFASHDGVAFFNVLAFRGVFFGSPFARSAHYRWFESLNDWTTLRTQLTAEANEYGADDEYYVNPGCYGRPQKDRNLTLLDTYWERRLEWNDKINRPIKPSIGDVFNWLKGRTNGVNLFPNIGALSAMLICGDLVEAGILPMPPVKEWATLIHGMKKGAMSGMEMYVWTNAAEMHGGGVSCIFRIIGPGASTRTSNGWKGKDGLQHHHVGARLV